MINNDANKMEPTFKIYIYLSVTQNLIWARYRIKGEVKQLEVSLNNAPHL